jgi:hypothetical protein
MPTDDGAVRRALNLVRLLHQGQRLRAAALRPGATGGKRRDALPVLAWYGEVTGAIEGIGDARRRTVARLVIVEYRRYREVARAARCGTATVSRLMNGRGGLWDWWEELIGRLGVPPRGEEAEGVAESGNADNR